MVLLDSLYINIGGGKILLDYLVAEIEKNKYDVFYLFDSRCEGDYNNIPENKKLYLKASSRNRYLFYKKNKINFSSVLCFGNIPPPIKLSDKTKVFTYFHQPLFIGDDSPKNIFAKFTIFAKTTYIKLVKKNTSYWLIQNNRMKNGLKRKYNIQLEHLLIVPFFKPLPVSNKNKEKNTFAYISMAPPHKNHLRLIETWELLCKEGIKPVLHLTVPEESNEVNNKITKAKEEGVNIINHGYVSRDKVSDILHSSEFMIFPSLAESFGLPLVEGIESGCKVIASDLDYTYQVIKPSHSFDPYSSTSIAKAVKYCMVNEIPYSKPKIKNEIKELFELLGLK